jgi:hypothetical protein
MRNRALTLIEVVAALSLIAGTATVLLTLQGRCIQQLRAAHDRERAAHYAAELVGSWRLNPAPPGILEATIGDEFRWRRTERDYPTSTNLLREVTLVVFRVGLDHRETPLATYAWLENKLVPERS